MQDSTLSDNNIALLVTDELVEFAPNKECELITITTRGRAASHEAATTRRLSRPRSPSDPSCVFHNSPTQDAPPVPIRVLHERGTLIASPPIVRSPTLEQRRPTPLASTEALSACTTAAPSPISATAMRPVKVDFGEAVLRQRKRLARVLIASGLQKTSSDKTVRANAAADGIPMAPRWWLVAHAFLQTLCTVICLWNGVGGTRSYRDVEFAVGLVALHVTVQVTWYCLRAAMRSPEWIRMMDVSGRPEYYRRFGFHLSCVHYVFWTGSVLAIVIIYAGWVVPIMHSLVDPLPEERHWSTRIELAIHGGALLVIIVPWVLACIGGIVLYALFTVVAIASLRSVWDATDAKISRANKRGTNSRNNSRNNSRRSSLSHNGGILATASPLADHDVADAVEDAGVQGFLDLQLESRETADRFIAIRTISDYFSLPFVLWLLLGVLLTVASLRHMLAGDQGRPSVVRGTWSADGHVDIVPQWAQDILYLGLGSLVPLCMLVAAARITAGCSQLTEHVAAAPDRIPAIRMDKARDHVVYVQPLLARQGGFYVWAIRVTPAGAAGLLAAYVGLVYHFCFQ